MKIIGSFRFKITFNKIFGLLRFVTQSDSGFVKYKTIILTGNFCETEGSHCCEEIVFRIIIYTNPIYIIFYRMRIMFFLSSVKTVKGERRTI